MAGPCLLGLPARPSLANTFAHSRDRFLVNFQRRAKVILNEAEQRRNCPPPPPPPSRRALLLLRDSACLVSALQNCGLNFNIEATSLAFRMKEFYATAPFRERIEFRYWGDLPSSEGKRTQFMKLILNQQMRLGYAAVETKSKRKLT